MPNPTLQEIVTHFHDKGYNDTTLASIVGLSQATINNIRNGKQTGNRTQDKFSTLIHAFLNNEELAITPSKPAISNPKPVTNVNVSIPENTANKKISNEENVNNEPDNKPVKNTISLSFIVPIIVMIVILFIIQQLNKHTKNIYKPEIPLMNEVTTNSYIPNSSYTFYRQTSNTDF